MSHTKFQRLKDKGASIVVTWDFIKTHPTDMPAHRERVFAQHIEVQGSYKNQILKVLDSIYDKNNRNGFPLHRKCIMLPNAGEKAMAVGSQKIPTLIKARIAQRKMKEETKIYTLDNAIDNIDASILHGGPSLREIISGMQHPHENRPSFSALTNCPMNSPPMWLLTELLMAL